MADPKICVDSTQVSITPIPPLVITKIVDKVPGGSQSLMKSEGKLVLLPEDFDKWTKNYSTNYFCPPFVLPGTLAGNSIQMSGISTKTKVKGSKVILQISTGIMTLKKTKPAQMPPPVGTPDPMPLYTVQVAIISPAQAKSSSL